MISAISPTITGKRATKLAIPMLPEASTPTSIMPVITIKPVIRKDFPFGFIAFELGLTSLLIIYRNLN